MAPSRKSLSFTIHLYWDFSKSWSQIKKVGVKYSKFGVNETSDNCAHVRSDDAQVSTSALSHVHMHKSWYI